VFEKCQTQKYLLAEERHQKTRGRGSRRSLSDYGKQLLEKQKVRLTYGLAERQFARYVKESVRRGAKTNPAQELVTRLESRLDNVVFRCGLAPTRRAARQMVSHGHILVNGQRVTVPSLAVSSGDAIAIREGSRDKRIFDSLEERLADAQMPAWISFDAKKKTGTVEGTPTQNVTELPFDIRTVLEYYSR
jgi:small subunit ribosomal protein S4